jgi:hypothetical protein
LAKHQEYACVYGLGDHQHDRVGPSWTGTSRSSRHIVASPTPSRDRKFADSLLERDGFEPLVPNRSAPVSETAVPSPMTFWRSRDQEPKVRIHFPPADSPSLTGSSALRSRTPAVRAGVRAMGGGAVRRDGDRPATWRLPAQCLCRAKFQYRNASDVVQGGRSSCRLAMLRLAQPVKRSRASSVAHPR